MTVHIDISRSTTTLAEVIDLVVQGESVIVDREGRALGELILQTRTRCEDCVDKG